MKGLTNIASTEPPKIDQPKSTMPTSIRLPPIDYVKPLPPLPSVPSIEQYQLSLASPSVNPTLGILPLQGIPSQKVSFHTFNKDNVHQSFQLVIPILSWIVHAINIHNIAWSVCYGGLQCLKNGKQKTSVLDNDMTKHVASLRTWAGVCNNQDKVCCQIVVTWHDLDIGNGACVFHIGKFKIKCATVWKEQASMDTSKTSDSEIKLSE